MDEQQFTKLYQKLDSILKAVVMFTMKDSKTKTDRIRVLSSYGFDAATIANLLGTTTNTVYVTLSESRKKGRNSSKKTT